MIDATQDIVDGISALVLKGLIVRRQRQPSPYGEGFWVQKPASVQGNSSVECSKYLQLSGRIPTDAPTAHLRVQDNQWIFKISAGMMPGPGIGDFEEHYSSFTEVVAAVLDYYFGDPSKMNPPALIYRIARRKAYETQPMLHLVDTIPELEAGGLVFEKDSDFDGYNVGKSASVKGNSQPGQKVHLGAKSILCDAPITRLYLKNDKWIFEVVDYAPGSQGFHEEYDRVITAMSSVVRYYLRDPARMNPPESLEQR